MAGQNRSTNGVTARASVPAIDVFRELLRRHGVDRFAATLGVVTAQAGTTRS